MGFSEGTDTVLKKKKKTLNRGMQKCLPHEQRFYRTCSEKRRKRKGEKKRGGKKGKKERSTKHT